MEAAAAAPGIPDNPRHSPIKTKSELGTGRELETNLSNLKITGVLYELCLISVFPIRTCRSRDD